MCAGDGGDGLRTWDAAAAGAGGRAAWRTVRFSSVRFGGTDDGGEGGKRRTELETEGDAER